MIMDLRTERNENECAHSIEGVISMEGHPDDHGQRTKNEGKDTIVINNSPATVKYSNLNATTTFKIQSSGEEKRECNNKDNSSNEDVSIAAKAQQRVNQHHGIE